MVKRSCELRMIRTMSEDTQDEESGRIYKEVIDWIEEYPEHFGKKGEELYDTKNLERIRRFANAPRGYIDERIELNKDVTKNYHKLQHSIILAGFTGFFAILLTQSIMEFFKTYQLQYLILWVWLACGAIIAMKTHLSYLVLKWIGLEKVIRDSEIEIYYLSKIKEHRKSST
jgi:hypothetical protein